MKFLLLLVLVVVVVWWVRRAARQARRDSPPDVPPVRPGSGEKGRVLMVSCAHCGLHLPRTESLPGPDDQSFCSESHRAAGPRP